MSKSNHQNVPDADDKRIPSDRLPESISEKNTIDRFLQDISSIKHIPELKTKHLEIKSIGRTTESPRGTLLEAIFNAVIIRNLIDTVKEFRILGANFINRSMLLGLSKEFGQSPFLALLKGETKDNLQRWDRLALRKALLAQSSKENKEKSLKNIKDIEQKIPRDTKKEDSKENTLLTSSGEEKPERIPRQENELYDENKQYNIKEDILKATELELSMPGQNKTLFENLEKTPLRDQGTSAKPQDYKMLSQNRLKQCIEQFSRGKVLVLGDLLIDELLEGKPERISREAPVLILEHVDTILIPGGAANAAHNVTALGGQCHAVGVVGQDEYAVKLAHLLEQHNISHSLITDPSRPTTVKTRILSKTHALMQQLLRLDRISHETISNTIANLVTQKLESLIQQYPVLILSDYRAGIMTDEIIHACRKITAERDITLIVDAQNNFERFQNVSLITPNQPDTEQAVGYKITNRAELLQAGEDMLMLTGAQAILITQGKEGMTLFRRGAEPFSLPAFNRSEVYDVSGAGDTVVATIALGLATGASLPEAIALGSIAASIVVRKPGTAVTSQKEILELLPTITSIIN